MAAKRRLPKSSSNRSRGPRGRTGARGPVGAAGERGPAGPPGPIDSEQAKAILALQDQVTQLIRQLQTQLTRIGQIQAQLDRIATGRVAALPRMTQLEN